MFVTRHAFAALLLAATFSGCAPVQLQENTLQVADTLEQIRFSQFMTNISDQLDRPDAIPSVLITNTGSAQSSLGGTVTSMFSNIGLATFSKQVTPAITGTWQDSWSLNPISDPQDLKNLRALYGLVTNTDPEIAAVIQDEMKWYNEYDLVSCGLKRSPSQNETVIDVPETAITAYFEALQAFPYQAQPQNTPPPAAVKKKPAPPATPSPPAFDCYGQALPVAPPAVVVAPSVSGISSPAVEPVQSMITVVGGKPQQSHVAALNASFGLSYPLAKEVYFTVAHGISAGCIRYQVNNRYAGYPADGNRLFTRWLFWKDKKTGQWAPYDPTDRTQIPYYKQLESLGVYGDHEFWTTASPCISDFIILLIKSTANSHSTAQASPKPSPGSPP